MFAFTSNHLSMTYVITMYRDMQQGLVNSLGVVPTVTPRTQVGRGYVIGVGIHVYTYIHVRMYIMCMYTCTYFVI